MSSLYEGVVGRHDMPRSIKKLSMQPVHYVRRGPVTRLWPSAGNADASGLQDTLWEDTMHTISSMERRIQALDPSLARLDSLSSVKVEVSEVLMYTDTRGAAAKPSMHGQQTAHAYSPAMHEGYSHSESPQTPPLGPAQARAMGKGHDALIQGPRAAQPVQQASVCKQRPGMQRLRQGQVSAERPPEARRTNVSQGEAHRLPEARPTSLSQLKAQRASGMGAKKVVRGRHGPAVVERCPGDAEEGTRGDDCELRLTDENGESAGRYAHARQQWHLVGRGGRLRLPERPNLHRPGVMQALKLDLS